MADKPIVKNSANTRHAARKVGIIIDFNDHIQVNEHREEQEEPDIM